jgi:hypothetical protein
MTFCMLTITGNGAAMVSGHLIGKTRATEIRHAKGYMLTTGACGLCLPYGGVRVLNAAWSKQWSCCCMVGCLDAARWSGIDAAW